MATHTQPNVVDVATLETAEVSHPTLSPELMSTYLQYLPAVFQHDHFVGRFLLAFERVLSGLPVPIEGETLSPGLEQYIENLYTYFKPISGKTPLPVTPGLSTQTPDEFLPWLASWVALSLREEWDTATKRQFISAIVPLYRLRGTKTGLRQLLELYLKSANLPERVDIFEFEQPPHFFQVQLVMSTPDQTRFWQQVRIAKTIIDQEKPAHTFYALKILTPTMQLSGRVYAVALKAPAQITAELRCTTPAKLALRIQHTQLESYHKSILAQQIGTNSLRVSTQSALNDSLDDSWSVTLTNLSLTPAQGSLKITVTYANDTGFAPEEREILLTPTIGAGLYLKQRAQGGNTFLGTEDRDT